MVAIEISGVGKVFETRNGRVEALSEISLSIGTGQFVSVLGPSGCGKSTLLSIIAGLESPTRGHVDIGDQRVRGPQTALGIVFQDPLLLDWRDALGNVLLQAEAKHLPRERARERALELLARVGLRGFEDKRSWELSGGMRQRVSICRALIHEPSLLLFDEPFGPLDALTREQLMLDLHNLWLQERQTVVFVTHSISEAVFLGDVVVVMTSRPGNVHEVIETDDLGTERDLDVQSSVAFQSHVHHIHETFRNLGVLGNAHLPESTRP